MTVKIKLFGQLADIIRQHELSVENVTDTDSLINEMKEQYPAMASVKFMLAVDKKITRENVLLKEGNVVALLPPFSGG
jgi:molybdopterin converting factor small subunit